MKIKVDTSKLKDNFIGYSYEAVEVDLIEEGIDEFKREVSDLMDNLYAKINQYREDVANFGGIEYIVEDSEIEEDVEKNLSILVLNLLKTRLESVEKQIKDYEIKTALDILKITQQTIADLINNQQNEQ